MLAFNLYQFHPNYKSMSDYNAFQPTIPSPLSPRSANVASKPVLHSRIFKSMSSSDQENTSASETGSGLRSVKRAVKKAPSPKQDELTEKRRRNFLKKVEDARGERRFEARREDMMRLDFYQRQRAWEAEQARSAPTLPWDGDVEEEVAELPESSWTGSAMQISAPATQQQPQMFDAEVDEVLAREDEEVAALLEFMPREDEMEGTTSDHLWSDDEDYDALFSELMEREEGDTRQHQVRLAEGEGEAMDTS